ncbi:hypothetical protein BCVP_CDS0236 [Bacillus phage BC-VP]|nr:hypothetical protein BCVP_CDS0236 [Bacillus phage BC-VP]
MEDSGIPHEKIFSDFLQSTYRAYHGFGLLRV